MASKGAVAKNVAEEVESLATRFFKKKAGSIDKYFEFDEDLIQKITTILENGKRLGRELDQDLARWISSLSPEQEILVKRRILKDFFKRNDRRSLTTAHGEGITDILTFSSKPIVPKQLSPDDVVKILSGEHFQSIGCADYILNRMLGAGRFAEVLVENLKGGHRLINELIWPMTKSVDRSIAKDAKESLKKHVLSAMENCFRDSAGCLAATEGSFRGNTFLNSFFRAAESNDELAEFAEEILSEL